MTERVLKFIKDRITINDAELEEVFAQCSFDHFKKGTLLLKRGQYCRFIGFLNQGLVMTSIQDSAGREKATGFIYDGCFFTYTEGLSLDTPSHKNFIALEDCEAIMLDKEKLPALFKKNQKLESLLTRLLSEEVTSLLMQHQAIKTKSLEERYLEIEKQYPNAFQRIPQKYLADYLDIEAPSLSRLRKRLSGK